MRSLRFAVRAFKRPREGGCAPAWIEKSQAAPWIVCGAGERHNWTFVPPQARLRHAVRLGGRFDASTSGTWLAASERTNLEADARDEQNLFERSHRRRRCGRRESPWQAAASLRTHR